MLEEEFKKHKLDYKREFRIAESGNILDFIVDSKIILELKAKPFVLKEDYYQAQRYMQFTKVRLTLLVNFRSRYLKPKRLVRLDTPAKNKFLLV